MTFSTTNFYLEWRERRSCRWALRETPGQPAERLLQAVWHHQRLRRDGLRLCDGRTLRVLHPGYWNRESGPDFRQAVLQMAGEPARVGDVEVDLHSSCWRQHKHDRNPAFQNVVLHVVWEADPRPQAPTLAIKNCLDAPLAELAAWLGTKAAETYPEHLHGLCAAALAKLSSEQRLDLLRQASLARLRRKASDLEARARQAGWEQALWEGLLRALGYKHNVWPMLRLGELRPALQGGQPMDLFHWQARLFGVSGLLPTELRRTNDTTDHYLRRVWDEWWRERDAFHDVILPVALWRLHGLRPANHPLRRLALVTHWWADGTVPARLEQWFTTAVEDKALESSLVEVMQAAADEFWSWHWTLRGRSLARRQPLAGPSRVTDLAVNVLLPWFWVRARHGGNPALQAEAERRYLAWPPTQDNSVLRLARQRLLPGVMQRGWNAAALQQGLLQLVRDFCDQTDPLCSECPFPDWVAEDGASRGNT